MGASGSGGPSQLNDMEKSWLLGDGVGDGHRSRVNVDVEAQLLHASRCCGDEIVFEQTRRKDGVSE